MNLSRAQLADILKRPGIREANPDLGAVATQKHKPTPRPTLVQDAARGQSRESSLGVVVSIVAVRNARCDEDNSRNGYKPLQDAIARTLNIDDGSERIRFEYGQMQTQGPEGTIVRIAWL